MASTSFGSKKRPAGKQWRSSSSKEIFDNLYKNVDAAFEALESAVNGPACDAATTANVNLAAPVTVSQDGQTLVAGNRLLVWKQTAPEQNGIYVVGTVATGSAPLTRAKDLDTTAEGVLGDSVWVKNGTAYGQTEFRITAAPATAAGFGVDPLVFSPVAKAALPSGAVDYLNPITRTGTAVFDPSANTAQRAVATHGIGPALPINAVITKAWFQTVTGFTSAGNNGATVSLGVISVAAGGIQGATAVTDPVYSGASINAGTPDGTVALFLAKTTSEGLKLSAIVAVQALTAGKLVVHFEYDIVA